MRWLLSIKIPCHSHLHRTGRLALVARNAGLVIKRISLLFSGVKVLDSSSIWKFKIKRELSANWKRMNYLRIVKDLLFTRPKPIGTELPCTRFKNIAFWLINKDLSSLIIFLRQRNTSRKVFISWVSQTSKKLLNSRMSTKRFWNIFNHTLVRLHGDIVCITILDTDILNLSTQRRRLLVLSKISNYLLFPSFWARVDSHLSWSIKDSITFRGR